MIRIDSATHAKTIETATALRRELHARPELTWQERSTADRIERQLRAIPGLAVRRMGETGVVAVLAGGAPGHRVVALRADMDALPITEKTGAPWTSQNAGVMHACGHDGHMAVLMGAVEILAARRSELPGKVVAIFQPAEEGGAGADVLCKAGVLDDPKVDAIFGLHGWPEAPLGSIQVRSGPVLASTSEIRIRITGRGTHAAFPHRGTDQVLVAARVVEALQSIRSREIDPLEPLVLTIGMIHGGNAINVIPDTVELGGTLRTLDMSVRDHCAKRIHEIVTATAAAHRASADVTVRHNYPVTKNDPKAAAFVRKVATDLLGVERVQEMPRPAMGGEDFAFYLERIPGAFFMLGMGGEFPLHHPQYDFNDAALGTGISTFVNLADEFLRNGFGTLNSSGHELVR